MAGALQQMFLATSGGVVSITGTLTAIEGADIAAFEGPLIHEGTLAAVEGADLAAFEGAFPITAFVAYLKKSSDLTATDLSLTVAVAWPAESVDTNNGHDLVTDNSKYIVPSALNGRYGVFHAMLGIVATASGAAVSVAIRKANSADYVGFGGLTKNSGNMSNIGPVWCCTQPVLLTTGDEYEVYAHSSDTSTTIRALNSSFSLEIVG